MKSEDHSSFVAAHAVAETEAYLRDNARRGALGLAADRLMGEIFLLPSAGDRISDPTRLLVIAMHRTSKVEGPREECWRDVLKALCGLVRHETGAAS